MKNINLPFLIMLMILVSCSTKKEEPEETSEPMEIIETDLSPKSFYIGTYTRTGSEGIYYAVFNPEDGSFTGKRLAARATDPSFLVLGARRDFVYSVDESLSDDGHSSIVAFRIGKPGSLIPVDTVSSAGTYACYITTDDGGQYVLAANYGSGNVISIPISSEGGLLDESDVQQHSGQGPNSSRQESPHAHSIVLDPNQRYALSADLGADKIMVYQVGPQGKLVENAPAYVETEPGAGPRHIAFHPNGNVVYVINELNSTITVYDYNQGAGILSNKQTIYTLPDSFTGDNSCADIHVHPSGKYLYGSNRGHDSIVVYDIDEEGRLSLAGHFSENVKWPRNFSISPDGGFLLVANERGNSIISAKIDPDTGIPSSTGHELEVASPVCIVFE